MDLNEILIFARVAHSGSFTRAAQELGMPKSTVSRKLSELEERLGARLLQRTTRRLSLTDVGRTYYQHCAHIVAAVEEAEHAVNQLQETPRGLLRVTAPLNFTFLGPIVEEFLIKYPEVQLELTCTDRLVALVDEGFDVGIRAGRLLDSTLVARPLALVPSYLVASPSYLKKKGRPKSPSDLAKHSCILFGAGAGRSGWVLQSPGGSVEVSITPRFMANDHEMLHGAALSGLGVVMLPAYYSAEEIKAKRLERVLPTWSAIEAPVSAVYPSSRHMSAKLKAFLEHLQKKMSPPPWESEPCKEAMRARHSARKAVS